MNKSRWIKAEEARALINEYIGHGYARGTWEKKHIPVLKQLGIAPPTKERQTVWILRAEFMPYLEYLKKRRSLVVNGIWSYHRPLSTADFDALLKEDMYEEVT